MQNKRIAVTLVVVAGIVLLVAAAVIALILATGGGPVIPHIVGPITLATIGVILLTRGRNSEGAAR